MRSITRRQFTVGTTSVVALTVLGCDSRADQADKTLSNKGGSQGKADGKKKSKANLATEPFLVGQPGRYTKPGVYTEYKDEKGIWLISDGRVLVALSATCTHLACSTDFDPENNRFDCPCHESRFSLEGINDKYAKAKRPLERCTVRLVNGQIEVDPTQRFRQEKGEWSNPVSSLPLG